jgi:hypothetical protein
MSHHNESEVSLWLPQVYEQKAEPVDTDVQGTYGISSLFSRLDMEIVTKTSHGAPLTNEEIKALKEMENAGGNTLEAALSGLNVVEEFLYQQIADGQNDSNIGGNINDASFLLKMLTEIIREASSAKSESRYFLMEHYKLLAERAAAEAAEFVTIPVHVSSAPKRAKAGAK